MKRTPPEYYWGERVRPIQRKKVKGLFDVLGFLFFALIVIAILQALLP